MSNLLNGAFAHLFYNAIKTISQRKKEDDKVLKKNRTKTKQCYHNDIFRSTDMIMEKKKGPEKG